MESTKEISRPGKFNLKFLLIILTASLVVLLSVFIFTYVRFDPATKVIHVNNPFVNRKNTEKLSVEQSNTPSAFNELVNIPNDVQQSSISEFLAYRDLIFLGINTDEWYWETDFAYASVDDFDANTSIVMLSFQVPDSTKFQPGNVKVSCPVKSTAVAEKTGLRLVEVGVDFFKTIEPKKDGLFFKCLNSTCDEIGVECIIVKGVIAE